MFRQCSFHSPTSTPYASNEGLVTNWRSISPLGEGEGFSVVSDHNISSSVILLFLASSPFAILFRVPSFVINSLYSHIGRAFTHIFEKVREFKPSITNNYASSPIIRVAFMVPVVTTLFHVGPYAICPCFIHSVGFTTGIAKARTTARRSVPRFEVRSFGFNFISTVTSAKPVDFLSATAGKLAFVTNCYKLTKSSIRYIGEITHRRILTHIKE